MVPGSLAFPPTLFGSLLKRNTPKLCPLAVASVDKYLFNELFVVDVRTYLVQVIFRANCPVPSVEHWIVSEIAIIYHAKGK